MSDEDDSEPTPRRPSFNPGGRPPGKANKDKVELRAMVQEAVLQHTTSLRGKLARDIAVQFPEFDSVMISTMVDEQQPLIEEYDPVVELSKIAADYRNDIGLRRQANSDAAQFLRPKLKTIEFLEDPEKTASTERKMAAAERIASMLHLLYGARSDATPAQPSAPAPESP